MVSKIGNLFHPIIDAIVYSNTWISLAAVSLYLSVKLLFGLAPFTYEVLLIFSATFIGYNLLKLKGLNLTANNSAFNRWMRQYKPSIYGLMLFSLLTLLYTLSQVSFHQLLVLSVTVIISLVYIGIERFNLRTFWFFKTQMVALVWAVFIMGIALAESWQDFQFVAIFVLFAAIFFFILALTIPFEIRDWKVDKLTPNLKTIPMVFGLKGTLVLSLLHLILSLFLLLLLSFKSIILIPLFTVAGIVIYSLNQDSPEYKFTLILDGLIILVYPLLWLVTELMTAFFQKI